MLIIQSHDIFVHHHDLPNEQQTAGHDADENHNVFSFVDIDEEFTLENKTGLPNGIVATLSPIVFTITIQEPNLVTLFVPKNEYPPPKPDISLQSLRGPPIS